MEGRYWSRVCINRGLLVTQVVASTSPAERIETSVRIMESEETRYILKVSPNGAISAQKIAVFFLDRHRMTVNAQRKSGGLI
jgi:hypothetical protein